MLLPGERAVAVRSSVLVAGDRDGAPLVRRRAVGGGRPGVSHVFVDCCPWCGVVLLNNGTVVVVDAILRDTLAAELDPPREVVPPVSAELRAGVECAAILEALRASVEWELAPSIKTEIIRVTDQFRALLKNRSIEAASREVGSQVVTQPATPAAPSGGTSWISEAREWLRFRDDHRTWYSMRREDETPMTSWKITIWHNEPDRIWVTTNGTLTPKEAWLLGDALRHLTQTWPANRCHCGARDLTGIFDGYYEDPDPIATLHRRDCCFPLGGSK